MRPAFQFLAICLTALMLSACSQGEDQTEQSLRSEVSELGWLSNCRSSASMDNADCFDRDVVWVLTMVEEIDPHHLIAQLGPRNQGLRVEIDLSQALAPSEDNLQNRTFFLRGKANMELTVGRRAMVRIADGQILGFQTLVDGPKQGAMAADLTLAEFGRYCLFAPQEIYTNQCAGRRVVWYGLLRGAANDGVVLGLPFDDASSARVKTASPLSWPIGNTSVLRDQPMVIEGILGTGVGRSADGERVPLVEEAHIVSFSRRTEPLSEITGVQ